MRTTPGRCQINRDRPAMKVALTSDQPVRPTPRYQKTPSHWRDEVEGFNSGPSWSTTQPSPQHSRPARSVHKCTWGLT
jgi:hypothetical protein